MGYANGRGLGHRGNHGAYSDLKKMDRGEFRDGRMVGVVVGIGEKSHRNLYWIVGSYPFLTLHHYGLKGGCKYAGF